MTMNNATEDDFPEEFGEHQHHEGAFPGEAAPHHGEIPEFEEMPGAGPSVTHRLGAVAHDHEAEFPEADDEMGHHHLGALDHEAHDDLHETTDDVVSKPKGKYDKLIMPAGGAVLVLAAIFFTKPMWGPKVFGGDQVDTMAVASAPSNPDVGGPHLPPSPHIMPPAPATLLPPGAIKPPFPLMHNAPSSPGSQPLDEIGNAAPPAATQSVNPELVKTLTALTEQLKAVGTNLQSVSDNVDQTRKDLSKREDTTDTKLDGVDGHVGDMEKKMADLEHRLALVEAEKTAPVKAGRSADTKPQSGHASHQVPPHHTESVSYSQQAYPVKAKSGTVKGYVLRGISRGNDAVLVQTPSGQLLPLTRGQSIPGIGKVLDYRQDGDGWVVDTPKGVIRP
jgi:hypothetical protein